MRKIFEQVWALLPGFCACARDVAEALPLIAQSLGRALAERPEVQGHVLSALSLLVLTALSRNGLPAPGTTPALGKALVPTKLALAPDAVTALATVGRYGEYFLPLLFELHLRVPPAEQPVLQEAVRTVASVTPDATLGELFEVLMRKLLEPSAAAEVGEAEALEAQRSMLDLLLAVTPSISLSHVAMLHRAVQPMLLASDALLQKKAYKVLGELCEHHAAYATAELPALKRALDEGLPACLPGAKGERLACLQAVANALPAAALHELLPALLGEVEHVNVKTRAGAFELLMALSSTAELRAVGGVSAKLLLGMWRDQSSSAVGLDLLSARDQSSSAVGLDLLSAPMLPDGDLGEAAKRSRSEAVGAEEHVASLVQVERALRLSRAVADEGSVRVGPASGRLPISEGRRSSGVVVATDSRAGLGIEQSGSTPMNRPWISLEPHKGSKKPREEQTEVQKFEARRQWRPERSGPTLMNRPWISLETHKGLKKPREEQTEAQREEQTEAQRLEAKRQSRLESRRAAHAVRRDKKLNLKPTPPTPPMPPTPTTPTPTPMTPTPMTPMPMMPMMLVRPQAPTSMLLVPRAPMLQAPPSSHLQAIEKSCSNRFLDAFQSEFRARREVDKALQDASKSNADALASSFYALAPKGAPPSKDAPHLVLMPSGVMLLAPAQVTAAAAWTLWSNALQTRSTAIKQGRRGNVLDAAAERELAFQYDVEGFVLPLFASTELLLAPMDPTGCGTPALNDLILNHTRHPIWDVRAQGQRVGDSYVLCGGDGFDDITLVGSVATADRAVDSSSAFLTGCRFMNLFVTRNPVPHSLPGDLGPLIEVRTTHPELQLIVPAMHFAEHAHMNKLFGLHDVAGIEQVVLVPFNSRTMVSREQALAQAPAVVREDVLDVVAVDAAHLGRPMPACDVVDMDLDGVALALANAYDEATFEGLATFDAVADSESIRLGHRVRPQAKDVAAGEDVLQLLGPGASSSGGIYPPRLLRNVLGGDSTMATRRAVVDQLEVASSRVMGSTAELLSQAAPHVLARMGVAMGGSVHVYPPRQWQENVAGRYLPAASLVIRKKGRRADVQHDEGFDVLAAARRQVGMHSDDGDDFGLLVYMRPVIERPTADWRWGSLGEELEVVLRRGGLALALRLRGGRGVAVWAPYHMRPAQYRPRVNDDRNARVNLLAAWRAAGAPRVNGAG